MKHAKLKFTHEVRIAKLYTDNQFFISYDVESLFTNISLTEAIDTTIDLIFNDNPKFPIYKKDLKQLFLNLYSN